VATGDNRASTIGTGVHPSATSAAAPIRRPVRNAKRIVFTLHGKGPPRRYALIQTGGKNWLLHLTKEQPTG
jgi:hypothetical protein